MLNQSRLTVEPTRSNTTHHYRVSNRSEGKESTWPNIGNRLTRLNGKIELKQETQFSSASSDLKQIAKYKIARMVFTFVQHKKK